MESNNENNKIINNESQENNTSNNINDSFAKVSELQKLIHKQAGLKRLCKKINLIKKILNI